MPVVVAILNLVVAGSGEIIGQCIQSVFRDVDQQSVTDRLAVESDIIDEVIFVPFEDLREIDNSIVVIDRHVRRVIDEFAGC